MIGISVVSEDLRMEAIERVEGVEPMGQRSIDSWGSNDAQRGHAQGRRIAIHRRFHGKIERRKEGEALARKLHG